MADSGRQIGDCPHGWIKDKCTECLLAERAELDRLRDWKNQATTVIRDWEAVGAALEVDKIGPLGEKKSAIALREVVRLREVNAELLVALELTLQQLDKWSEPHEDDLPAIEAARAAIAKHRGQHGKDKQ